MESGPHVVKEALLPISKLCRNRLANSVGLCLGDQCLLCGGSIWQQICGLDDLAELDVAVEGADDGICVVDGDRTDVSERLDLGGTDLVFLVRHVDIELVGAGLDGVPASEAGCLGCVSMCGRRDLG
jgi:hypothetical protein